MDSKIIQINSSQLFYRAQNNTSGTQFPLANISIRGKSADQVSVSDSSKLLSSLKQTFSDAVKTMRDRDIPQNKETSENDVINDEQVQKIIDLGKSVEKPDDEISDFQWGMMVQLGDEMGITDSDALANLTTEDLDRYINEFYKKPLGMKTASDGMLDGNGNVFEPKSYDTKGDYWADVFQTDSNGEILKDPYGNPLRNSEFKQDTLVNEKLEQMNASVKVDSELAIKPYVGKLINMSPALLQNYTFALASGDMAALDYAKNATGTLTGSFDNWLPKDFSKYTDEQKISAYKEELNFGFRLLQSSLMGGPSSKQVANNYMDMVKSGDYVWRQI